MKVIKTGEEVDTTVTCIVPQQCSHFIAKFPVSIYKCTTLVYLKLSPNYSFFHLLAQGALLLVQCAEMPYNALLFWHVTLLSWTIVRNLMEGLTQFSRQAGNESATNTP